MFQSAFQGELRMSPIEQGQKKKKKKGVFAIVLHISIMKVMFLPHCLMIHDFFSKEKLRNSYMPCSHWVLKEVEWLIHSISWRGEIRCA